MKYIKTFESHGAPQIGDVIENSYQKHTSNGITDKEELKKLMFEDAKDELSYGISLFFRSGNGEQVLNHIIESIDRYLRKK